MNYDYLALIGLGLFGLLILLIVMDNTKLKDLDFRMKFHVGTLYILIFLGFIGLILFVIDLLQKLFE